MRRHVTLAMFALAFLVAVAADAAPGQSLEPHHHSWGSNPISLTVPETATSSAPSSIRQSSPRPGCCTGRTGADATSQQLGTATTDDAHPTKRADRSRTRTGLLGALLALLLHLAADEEFGALGVVASLFSCSLTT